MFASNYGFVAWEEHIICPERGRRVVHFYLKNAEGHSVLAVIGTEKSIRHMLYVVTGQFSATYGAEILKWRARREVVEWLQSLTSRPCSGTMDKGKQKIDDAGESHKRVKLDVDADEWDWMGKYVEGLSRYSQRLSRYRTWICSPLCPSTYFPLQSHSSASTSNFTLC